MKLEKSQHVICCLKNNAILEGTIESWSDDEVVLLSLDTLSRLIIPRPKEDIVFVKVVLESLKQKELPEIKQHISQELGQVLQEEDVNLKDKSIRHLKALVDEQERKIIKEKIKDHQLGQPRVVSYYYPGTNIKQPGK